MAPTRRRAAEPGAAGANDLPSAAARADANASGVAAPGDPRPDASAARRDGGFFTWRQATRLAVAVPLAAMLLLLNVGFGDSAHDGAQHSLHAVVLVLMLIVLGAAPLTHVLAKLWFVQYSLWQPFLGGTRFVLLQFVGWTLYAAALLGTLVYLYYVNALGRAPPSSFLLLGVGLAALASQMLMLFSLGFFSSASTDAVLYAAAHVDAAGDEDALAEEGMLSSATPAWLRRRWNSILTFALVSACLSFLLFGLLELTSSAHSWAAPVGIVAALLILAAAPITHGVAGRAKHARQYRFYMPFEGGPVFVFLQAFGWICYSLCLLLALYTFYLLVNGLSLIQGLVFTMGTSGLAAQVCLAISVFIYSTSAKGRARPASANARAGAGAGAGAGGAGDLGSLGGAGSGGGVGGSLAAFVRAAALDALSFCVVGFVYNMPFLEFCLLVALSFVLREHAVVLWALFLSLLIGSDVAFAIFCLVAGVLQTPLLVCTALLMIVYWRTYRHAPHITGARRWQALRETRWLWDSFQRYFSAVVLADAPLDAAATYVFGFHPHGIYPVTSMWISLCAEWRARLPGVEYDSMAASIIFYLPLVRDVAMWFGARDVSRAAITHALASRRSVMVVPGGQAEMFLHTNDRNRVRIVRRHSGFVRLAIAHGAALVPIFSFGENSILSNVHVPRLQRWSVRYLGFGLPHYPHGRLYTTLPIPEPLTVAVGAPIPVRQCEAPSEAEVARVHAQFYAALRDLFDRRKAEAGYADAVLEFDDEV